MDSAMEVVSVIFLPDRPKSLTDRYHSLAYLLPNDETENDRLDMLHEIFLMLLNRKLYLAPIKKPQRAIDLATGTGIWAIDFGRLVFMAWSTQDMHANSS